jgi:lipopolysaccharide transport system permease protein
VATVRSHELGEPPILVIRPTRGWAPLQLAELWRYRELVYFLAWRNVLVRYKQTALGIAWAVVQPLTLMAILTLFFGGFARRYGVPGPLFFFSGLVVWTFFANAVTQSSNSLVGNATLLSKVYFPRLAAPIAAVLAALVDFAAAFAVLLVMLVAYGSTPQPIALVAVPALLLLAVLTALGIGVLLSALNVTYRDVQYVVPFLLQVGLFGSAVAFSATSFSEPWDTLLGLNPMAGVVEGFRWALVGSGSAPGPMVALSACVSLVLFVASLFYFRRVERTFADVV